MSNHVFRALGILLMMVGMFVVYSMLGKQRKKQEEMIREIDTGKITFRGNEVEAAMGEAEERFKQAGAALEAGELMASFDSFHKGRGLVSVYVDQHGEQVVDGQTIAIWYEEHTKPYFGKMVTAFQGMLDQLKQGQVDPGEVKDLANFFNSDGLLKLKEIYGERLPEIEKARARQAAGWLRLHVYGGDKDFLEVVRSRIAERMGEPGGAKVVPGYSMGPEETRATWKSLAVAVNIENASYQFEGKTRDAYQFVQPNIPKSAKVEFKLEGAGEVVTNWDKQKPIRAEIDVPASILLKKGNDGEAQAKQIAAEHRQQLLAALDKAMETLPKLVLFPDIDIETAAMVKDGRLDRQVVMAIAYADRGRVLGDLSTLAKEGVESSHGDVAWLAVALGMEELAGFVADKLPGLDGRVQTEVLRELEKRPHYGDFEPLLAVIHNASPRQTPPSAAVQALGKHLDEEKVKKAFVDKVGDPSSPGRSNYVPALVRGLPGEELAALAPVWIADQDENFARQAFTQIRNRDQALANVQMEKLFDKVSPAVRQSMLQGFRFNENEHSPEMLELLKQAAAQREDKGLRQSALGILVDAAYVAEIWDFLDGQMEKESDARERERIKERLVYHLRRAHAEDADAILTQWLEDASGQIRFSVTMALLEQDDDKKAKLQMLADRLKAGQDPEILRGAVQAAYQYWKLRKGWDAEPLYEPLGEVLKMGLASDNGNVRQQAQEVVSRAMAAGDARYGELK